MCGINGIVRHRYDETLESQVQRMNDLIIHRGPDDSGVFLELGESSVCMGMRRLSIIDLSTGSQPMYNDDKTLVIVFNGEIYNYRQLRAALEREGVRFITSSDTEVILRLYEKHGSGAFSRLDGMFAFSIYDKRRQKIVVARDYFGEKPLYYYRNGERFLWASELKSIAAVLGKDNLAISNTALNLYFQLSYIPEPFSIYEDVFKLERNTVLEYDILSKTITKSVIERAGSRDYHGISEREAEGVCFDLVFNSVQSRSVADVPLGAFLSGGVDSSIVSWCLSQQRRQKIDTFSIGFKNKLFDESKKSQTVAGLINSSHHEFIIDEDDIRESIDRILLNFDEPFADSSALVSYLVANKTASRVKVALTGDGGDEAFGGYNKYYMGMFNRVITKTLDPKFLRLMKRALSPLLRTKVDNRGFRFKLRKLLDSIDYSDDFYYNIISLGFSGSDLKSILRDNIPTVLRETYKNKIGDTGSGLKAFRLIDQYLSLSGDMLVKVDRTSMLSSLECRAPFLNTGIWDFVNQLPEGFLIKRLDKKHLLKRAFEKYFPRGFFDLPKQGFAVPAGDWLRGSLRPELAGYTETGFLNRQNIFNTEHIQRLVRDHLDQREDNTFKVWVFFCFQKWYAFNILQILQ